MMRSFVLLLSGALAALSLPAAAEKSGWYIGLGGGQAKYQDVVGSDDLEPLFDEAFGVIGANGAQSSSDDDSDTGWKLFVGYDFNNVISLEGYYADLGKAKADIKRQGATLIPPGDTFFGDATADLTHELKSVGASMLFGHNFVDWFRLYGRVGFHYTEAKTEFKFGLNGCVQPPLGVCTPASESSSDTDTERGLDALLGVGAEFQFAGGFGIRLEWERYNQVKILSDKTNVDLISANLLYRF